MMGITKFVNSVIPTLKPHGQSLHVSGWLGMVEHTLPMKCVAQAAIWEGVGLKTANVVFLGEWVPAVREFWGCLADGETSKMCDSCAIRVK